MSQLDVIRAWKDEDYRLGLSESDRALLPENPAGLIELADSELDMAGGHTWHAGSMGCCPFLTHTTCIGFTVCGAICNTAWCTF